MADLIITVKEDQNKSETKSEIFPCEKCEKIFEKKGTQSLHMRKAHNIKTI